MTDTLYDLNHWMPTLSRSGQGQAIVLCHGGPAVRDYLDDLPDFFPTGWEIFRYTQRGAPRSPGPYTVAQSIADLESIREGLGLEQWWIGGHSWGAFLGLAYAVAHPERCLGLVLLNGIGLNTQWQSQYRAARRKKLSAAHQIESLHLQQELAEACNTSAAGYRRRLRQIHAPTDLANPLLIDRLPDPGPVHQSALEGLMRDWNHALHDSEFVNRAQALKMPVLCLNGAADPRPNQGAQALAEILPQGRWVELSACGHYPWIEQPEAFRDALADFLTPFGKA